MMRALFPITAMLALIACSEAPQATVYQHDQCHRLQLVDDATGLDIVGAEEMLRLPNHDLLVSAYDRRSKTKDGSPPEGGIYIVPRDALSKKTFKVSSLIKTLPGGLRPHGMDAIELENDVIKVAFVNRGAVIDGKPHNSIVRFDLDGERASKPQITHGEAFCRANDVAFYKTKTSPHSLAVTLDRKYCTGFKAFVENISGSQQGSLITLDNEAKTIENLAFPNGVGIQFPKRLNDEANFLAVAETRANRISYHPKSSARDEIKLPGSPDNMSVWKPGIILAALHPSLTRLALYRYKWPGFSKAPSRVVKVTGTQALLLFDDPTGELFSAASIAVQTAGNLVLGSVGDSGLLVCDGRSSS